MKKVKKEDGAVRPEDVQGGKSTCPGQLTRDADEERKKNTNEKV